MSSNPYLQRSSRKGLFLSLAATVLLATNFITAKYAMEGFNPWFFSMLWTSAAAVYAFLILGLTGRLREIILPPSLWPSMLCLGLSTAAAMILGWSGLAIINPSYSAFLWRFAPVLAILFGVIFLSEKLDRRIAIPAVLMVGGGLISASGKWDVVWLGTILTVLSCLATATQWLIAKVKVSQIHPSIITFYRVFIGALALIVAVFVSGKVDYNVNGRYWAVMLLGAFLGPCMSHFLMFRAYLYWDLSRASIVMVAQPVFVIPLAYIFLHKFPAGMELLGGLIILAGGFWLALVHRKKPPG